MRKILIALIACLIGLSCYAQENTVVKDVEQDPLILSPRDSMFLEYMDIYLSQLRGPRYKLYPTQNTWTFIKLDTMTGQLWQVQYSVDKSPRMEYTLDDDIKVYTWEEQICGRFELYETKNMYNFILLDTINGKCWQVQWSIEDKNRFVIRIY
ncbi:MAG: hypothetical protein MJY97_01275 [Bacteroidales bacterium]|nr:hypothetical protein [Bacteroidales bacterium]